MRNTMLKLTLQVVFFWSLPVLCALQLGLGVAAITQLIRARDGEPLPDVRNIS